MAGRFVSPFVLDDVENSGSYVSTTDDVSLYDATGNAMESKATRPRPFLDDSLEEEEELNFVSTHLTSCSVGGSEKNPAVAGVAETNAVDRLETVESGVNVAKKDCNVSSGRSKDYPVFSECMTVTPLASEPPTSAAAGVDKTSPGGHKEEPTTVQSYAKVMPTFGKKKVTLKAEIPTKAKKPVSKGIVKVAKEKPTATADSKKSVEEEAADLGKNSTEIPCCSLQSLKDTCPDPTRSKGEEVTAINKDHSGDDAGKTHSAAEKKESAGEGHIQKKKQNGEKEQKQCSQKMGKEKQVANKEKLSGAEKKLEQERRKAKREEEKIEKELRMIEREFKKLEKESRTAKKQGVAVCKLHMADEVIEKNEFQIFNMEEESQLLDCVQSSRVDVMDSDSCLPTQKESPKRAVPDEAAIPVEEAHLISNVPKGGEEEEQNGPDPPGNAAVPTEESHASPSEQIGMKKNIPSHASNAGMQKLSLNRAKKTPGRAGEGFGKQKGMFLKEAPSRGSKETAVGVKEQLQSKDEQAIGGPTTAGRGASGGSPAIEGGASGGSPAIEGGASGSSPAIEGGASGGSTTAGASKGPSTAEGQVGKGQKEKVATIAGALKRGVGNSARGTNKYSTVAASAKLNKEKDHVDVKQMKKFIAKTGKRKCDPSDASPTRKKTKTHSQRGPVWVQCDDCKKWRALKDCCDPSEMPEKWVCSMNKDATFNSCALPEEDAEELRESQEFIYSPFVPGSIVWAKMCGYPWWPAMIDEDPDEETCYEFVGDDAHPAEYHVVFFGKPVSRAWVLRDGIRTFTVNCNMNDGASVPLKYRQGLQGAVQEALSAVDMSIDDRVAKFSFAKRYCSGNKRNRKQFTEEKLKATPKKPKAVSKKLKAEPKKPATPLSKELEVTPELSEATTEDSEATPEEPKACGSEQQGIDPSHLYSEEEED